MRLTFALVDQETRERWNQVVARLEKQFGQKPDLNAILFLIGIRELGALPEKNFSKEEKVNLMHIAVCKLLSYSGFYTLQGVDQDGWPLWEKTIPLPNISLFEQETMLRQHVVEYFERENLLD